MSWKKNLALRVLDNLPKNLSPRGHAVADWLILGSAVAGAAAMYRTSRVAAASALVLAAAEAASMAVSDYPGGVAGMISFPAHGRMGWGISGIAAAMPELMGLEGREKLFFYTHAAAVAAVVGLTDFTGTGSKGQVRRRVVHAEV